MLEYIDEIELHDSMLEKIERRDHNLLLYLDAYVRRLDKRRIWQSGFWLPVLFTIRDATVLKDIDILDEPMVILSSEESPNISPKGLLPLPQNTSGPIRLTIFGMIPLSRNETAYPEFEVTGSGLEIKQIGEPHDFEDFLAGEQF